MRPEPAPTAPAARGLLSSERLRLVPHSPAYAARLLDDRSREPHWAEGYPTTGDLEIAALVAQRGTLPPLPFVTYEVQLRDGGLAIGGAGFLGPPDGSGAVSVGYGIAVEHRGHRYATEAVRALVAAALQHGVTVVRAETEASNAASARVLQNAGFSVVRTTDEHRYHELRAAGH